MRDFKAEHTRRKQARKRLVVEIDKDTAAQLDEKLKAEGLTWSKWIKRKISEYLGGVEMDNNKRMEQYNKNCDLFMVKIKQLISKEVEEIKIHMDEFPEISFFIGDELRTSNYAQTICQQLNREYGFEFECWNNPLEFSMTLKLRNTQTASYE